MSNPSKARGTAFESAVVAYVASTGHFPYCERRALKGTRDTGDLTGLPIVVEVKCQKAMDLGNWATEAAGEARNAGLPAHWWAVWHKRRQRGVAESYVTLPAALFVEMLADWDAT